MRLVVKKLEIADLGQLQSLVIEHLDGIESGLTVIDSRLLLGHATMDIVALDADERAQRARDAAPARLPVRRRGQARVSQTRAPKVVVVMPAYNAGRTLRMTYEQLPKDTVNLVILVDDGSTDATLDVARQLGLEIFVH